MVEVYTAINMCEIARLNDKHDFQYSPSIALSKKEITAIQIKQRSKKALDATAAKALREKFAKEQKVMVGLVKLDFAKGMAAGLGIQKKESVKTEKPK